MNPELKAALILLFWVTLLWERPQVFSLLAASNQSFFLLIFGSVVSFGSTSTKRQNPVFQVTELVFSATWKAAFVRHCFKGAGYIYIVFNSLKFLLISILLIKQYIVDYHEKASCSEPVLSPVVSQNGERLRMLVRRTQVRIR